jgi:hypothetical protein
MSNDEREPRTENVPVRIEMVLVTRATTIGCCKERG